MPAPRYVESELAREDVDGRAGLLLLDFGTEWCGHCMLARSHTDAWVERQRAVEHVRVEDGPGRRLGRSFRVKLWPSLILLRDGVEIARVVRPRDASDYAPLDDGLRAQ